MAPYSDSSDPLADAAAEERESIARLEDEDFGDAEQFPDPDGWLGGERA